MSPSRQAGVMAEASEAVPIDMASYARALADGIEEALPGWVEGGVASIMTAWSGGVPPEVAEQARVAGQAAAATVGPRVRALLDADIDEQRSTPLAILRTTAVSFPTEVLVAAGVPPVVRDRAAEELFPDDLYDLVPASFADLGPDLADLGLRWGAAKAFEHMRRHGGRK
jgi:hypothetical protein